MKMLIKEKLSPHKSKSPEGYLICYDAILARTGKQDYYASELWENVDEDRVVQVDRKPEQVFSPATMASFENKPLTLEHPSENVNPDNHKEYAVGFVRDIRRGESNGQEVMLGNIVVTDSEVIGEIETGTRTELSCGYDCDITDEPNPEQINIRGNHIALCTQGRAGIAKIIDHKLQDKKLPPVPSPMRKIITGILNKYNGIGKSAHVYEITNELESAGVHTVREGINGWNKVAGADKEYYKDYLFSIEGYSNPIHIRYYAEEPDWEIKEINAHLGSERLDAADSKKDDISTSRQKFTQIEDSYIEYRGYFIEYDFYGKGEYSVQYLGDDVLFKTKEEAKEFIDEIIEKAESMVRDYGIKLAKQKIKDEPKMPAIGDVVKITSGRKIPLDTICKIVDITVESYAYHTEEFVYKVVDAAGNYYRTYSRNFEIVDPALFTGKASTKDNAEELKALHASMVGKEVKGIMRKRGEEIPFIGIMGTWNKLQETNRGQENKFEMVVQVIDKDHKAIFPLLQECVLTGNTVPDKVDNLKEIEELEQQVLNQRIAIIEKTSGREINFGKCFWTKIRPAKYGDEKYELSVGIKNNFEFHRNWNNTGEAQFYSSSDYEFKIDNARKLRVNGVDSKIVKDSEYVDYTSEIKFKIDYKNYEIIGIAEIDGDFNYYFEGGFDPDEVNVELDEYSVAVKKVRLISVLLNGEEQSNQALIDQLHKELIKADFAPLYDKFRAKPELVIKAIHRSAAFDNIELPPNRFANYYEDSKPIKLAETGNEVFGCQNQFGYDKWQLKIDHTNKTYATGNFNILNKTQIKTEKELKAIIAQLEDAGYHAISKLEDSEPLEYSADFHKKLYKILKRKKVSLEKSDQTKDDEAAKKYGHQKHNVLKLIQSQLELLEKDLEDDK